MVEARRALVLFATLAVSSAAQSQVAQTGSGMPTNPYERTREMNANDQLLNSPNDYLRRGVKDASVDALTDQAKEGRTRAAMAGEITPGAALSDKTGVAIGTIESVEAGGAVVATLAGKVKVPLEAFGINKKGLLVDLGKKDFDTLVAQANGH